MKVLGIIPARYASTRFPAKALAKIGDKTMLQRVYEQCIKANLDQVIIATDDTRIFQHVQQFGGNVEMTADTHLSGTDRCAEVAARHTDYPLIVNIQGDEPFIQPEQINLAIEPLRAQAKISTLVKKIETTDILFNPNVVKAIFDTKQQALYFSRHPIPFVRGVDQSDWIKQQDFYQHIGLYGFQRSVLLELTKLSASRLELSESLEQLRWLEHAYPIQIALTTLAAHGIDTPEDLIRVQALFLNTE